MTDWLARPLLERQIWLHNNPRCTYCRRWAIAFIWRKWGGPK